MDQLNDFAKRAHTFAVNKAKAEGKFEEMLVNRKGLEAIPQGKKLAKLQIGVQFLTIVASAQDMGINPLEAGELYLKEIQKNLAAKDN